MPNNDSVKLPEGEYAKYLATLAAAIVDEKSKARDVRWRAAAGAIVAALAVLGYVNITSIEDDLKVSQENMIPLAVKTYVDSNRSEIVGPTLVTLQSDLEARIALLQLVIAASELRQGDGFSNETRSAVVSLLEQVSNNKELVSSPQFAKPLEDIVDAFLGADLETYIDDIDDKLRSVVSARPGITASMLQHYGFRVLESNASTLDPKEVARLKHYASVSTHSFNSPENSATFNLGLAFIKAGMKRDPSGDLIFEDAKHWKPEEQEVFVRLTKVLAEEEISRTPTGKTDRIKALMQKVRAAYAGQFKELESQATPQNIDEHDALQKLLDKLGTRPPTES